MIYGATPLGEVYIQLTPRGDLLASSSHADDDRLAPALVACLEGGPHYTDIAGAVEGVVAAAIGHLDQLVLDSLALGQFRRIYKISCAELLTPLLLRVVNVDDDDLAGLVLDSALDNRQPYAAGTEHSDIGAFLNAALAGRNSCGTIARSNAAAKQAGAVHRGLLLGDSDDGDVGDDGVLREGRRAHEVQQVLALALEA